MGPKTNTENDDLPLEEIAYQGKNWVAQQALAMQTLQDHFPKHFAEVISVLHSLKGKVILSGVGKSGLVARHVTATLSATGTPSFFMHPTESIHGDMGSLCQGDALMLWSWSGRTKELEGLLAHANYLNVYSIAVTHDAQSFLAQHTRQVLKLPFVEEICPLGLAPTTSATLMLVLGQVLAMSLSSLRGTTREEYATWHPGGSLGKRLLPLQRLMRKGHQIPIIAPEHTLEHALTVMTAKGIGCSAVVDGHNILRGVVTDGDVRRHLTPELWEQPVSLFMTRNPLTLEPHATGSQAIALMQERRISAVFVVDPAGHLKGVVHLHDLLG